MFLDLCGDSTRPISRYDMPVPSRKSGPNFWESGGVETEDNETYDVDFDDVACQGERKGGGRGL